MNKSDLCFAIVQSVTVTTLLAERHNFAFLKLVYNKNTYAHIRDPTDRGLIVRLLCLCRSYCPCLSLVNHLRFLDHSQPFGYDYFLFINRLPSHLRLSHWPGHCILALSLQLLRNGWRVTIDCTLMRHPSLLTAISVLRYERHMQMHLYDVNFSLHGCC